MAPFDGDLASVRQLWMKLGWERAGLGLEKDVNYINMHILMRDMKPLLHSLLMLLVIFVHELRAFNFDYIKVVNGILERQFIFALDDEIFYTLLDDAELNLALSFCINFVLF